MVLCRFRWPVWFRLSAILVYQRKIFLIMILQLINYTVGLFIFIFPLFFLRLTSDAYEYNKMVLFILFSLILFFLFSLKAAVTGKIKIAPGPYGPFLILIAAGAAPLRPL